MDTTYKTKIKFKKTYHYYGYPQARRTYEFEGDYFSGSIEYYGNQGYDVPAVKCKRKCNGYFWQVNALKKDFYSGNLRTFLSGLKLNEEESYTLQY